MKFRDLQSAKFSHHFVLGCGYHHCWGAVRVGYRSHPSVDAFLISDLPLIAALVYVGYGLGQRLNVALPRVALTTVTGIAYYIFVREVLGFK